MKYLIRSVKYFISLCVLCTVLMALMLATGTSALNLEQTIYVMLHTDRYLMLFGALIALAAAYPWFGFVVRSVTGDLLKNREQIINAFRSAGFELDSEQPGEMIFRAQGIFQKVRLLGEDKITVTQQNSQLKIDGIRSGVARVQYRLESYLEMTKND